MELRASFDAWLHAECGLTFQDVATYTPQELTRLQLGWLIREDPGGDRAQQRRGTPMDERKRELQAGQQDAREEMLEEVGVT